MTKKESREQANRRGFIKGLSAISTGGVDGQLVMVRRWGWRPIRRGSKAESSTEATSQGAVSRYTQPVRVIILLRAFIRGIIRISL